MTAGDAPDRGSTACDGSTTFGPTGDDTAATPTATRTGV